MSSSPLPGMIHLGMSRREAYQALGLPAALDRYFIEGSERQRWVFTERGLRLYFEGDELAAWHSKSSTQLRTALRGPRLPREDGP